MAVQAAGTAEDPATIAGSLVALIDELQDTMENQQCRPADVWSGVTWFVTRNGVNPCGFRHTLWAAV
jgi:hypothetical protein